jgi:imidazolonepropionase-like amidohydrolase
LAEEWVAHVPQELADGFRAGREEVARRMTAIVRSGVRFVIGSDGLHGRLAEDVRLVVEAGAAPAEALAAVGPRTAEMMGLADECGRLAPGIAADLIALPGNPLEDPGHLGQVEVVIRAGQVVKRRPA